MFGDIIINTELVNWVAVVIALGSMLLAIVALAQTSKANKTAERALQMQIDDSKVRLVVTARLMWPIEGVLPPHPFIDVVNLSSFPVVIEQLWWKHGEKQWFLWRKFDVADPFSSLPVQLPPHMKLSAMGEPVTKVDKVYRDAIAVAAVTACGERIEGTIEEFHAAMLGHIKTLPPE